MDEQRNAMASVSQAHSTAASAGDQGGTWGDQHTPGETTKACTRGQDGPGEEVRAKTSQWTWKEGGKDDSRQSRHRPKSWVDGGKDRKHSRRQEAVGTDQASYASWTADMLTGGQ